MAGTGLSLVTRDTEEKSMPTYEYACTSCGHHLEVFQSFSEDPLTACPNCAGGLRKVFGSIGIVLKGSGFYRTDSRSSSNGKAASKEREKNDTEKSEKKGSASSGSGSESAAPASSTSSSASTSSSKGSDSSPKAAASSG
jgi:putative FmdB family regulatory protein